MQRIPVTIVDFMAVLFPVSLCSSASYSLRGPKRGCPRSVRPLDSDLGIVLLGTNLRSAAAIHVGVTQNV